MDAYIIGTTSKAISSGGTINGNLTIAGDLTVSGGGSRALDEILGGVQELDITNAEAFLVRKNGDGGDVFTINTSTVGAILLGALTIGSDGSGHDVIFYSGTAGDNFTWDASAEKLTITGTDGQTALDVADGNLVVADNATFSGTIGVGGAAADGYGISSGKDVKIIESGSNPRLLIGDSTSGTQYCQIQWDSSTDAMWLGTDSDTDTLILDASSNATFAGDIDLEGSIDVNGTSNLDIVDIDGAVDMASTLQLDGALTVSADDTGADVRFYSATASEGLLYDASEDELGLLLTTKLKFHDIGGDEEIFASANGHLEINAGTTLDITAPTVDVNVTSELNTDGNVDVNGTFDASGAVGLASSSGVTTIGSSNGLTVSAAGVLTVNSATDATNSTSGSTIIDGGVGIAKKLYVGTDLDVDGTANLDAVDIDGAVQLDSTLTIGADDQGYDVIFYGDTASSNMTWDTSEDDLVLNDSRLFIDQDDDAVAFEIDSEQASDWAAKIKGKYGLNVSQDISGGLGLQVDRNIAESGTYPLLLINDGNANNTQPALKVQQAGAGYGINIDQNGNMPAIYIDSEATSQHGIHIDTPATTTGNGLAISNANSLTSGRLAYFYANGTDTTSRNLVEIHNDNALATGATGLFVDQDSDASSIYIDSESTSAAVVYVDANATTGGNGLEVVSNALTTGHNATFSTSNTSLATTASGGLVRILSTGDTDTNVNNLLLIKNDHADSTGTTGLYIQQDSTGKAMIATGDIQLHDATNDANIFFGQGNTVASPTYSHSIKTTASGTFEIKQEHSTAHKQLVLDANSKISLSNNDSSGAVGTTLLGYNAGLSIVSGAIGNTFIGHAVSDATMTNAADYNTGVGGNVLSALTAGTQNTAVGYQSLLLNTSGDFNTAIGVDALGTNVGTDNNTAVGNAAGYNTTGANNTYVGKSAGNGGSGAEAGNTAVGKDALESITDGVNNVAIGMDAGDTLTTGDYNVMIGQGAGASTTDVDFAILIGQGAGGGANMTADKTIAIGGDALISLTSGAKNLAIGYDAMGDMQVGTNNVAVGYESMNALQGTDGGYGNHNIAIGTDSMGSMEGYHTGTEIDGNIAIGTNALLGGDLGNNNIDFKGNIAIGYNALDATSTNAQQGTIGIGYNALSALTSGTGNTAVGFEALKTEDANSENTAIGYQSLAVNNGADGNTALGYRAGYDVTTGGGNAFLGAETGANVIGGADNVMIGKGAGAATTAGLNMVLVGRSAGGGGVITTAATGTVAIGHSALTALTSGPGNTAVGFEAGTTLTTGSNNTILGYQAFNAMDTGNENVAIGKNALGAATHDSCNYNICIGTDAGNGIADVAVANCVIIGGLASDAAMTAPAAGTIAIGKSALSALTSGARNLAIGYQALEDLTQGNDNIGIGYQALNGASTNASCIQNIAIGSYALDAISTNATNSCVGIGHNALTACTGDNNTSLGSEAGNEIVGGVNNTIIGAGASGEDGTAVNQSVFGKGATGVADNSVTLGNADVTAVYMAQDSGATVHCAGINMSANQPAAQAGSMTAEVLDHYEEGTWTIGVEFGGSATGISINAGRNVGTYTKVGNRVFITAWINLSDKGSQTGAATITGLPFTSLDSGGAITGIAIGYADFSFADFPMIQGSADNVILHMYEVTNSGAVTTITDGNWSDSTNLILSGHYPAAT